MHEATAYAWAMITSWLRDHAPVTARAIRPPAGEQEIRQTVTTLGHDLPEDLLTWWRLSDGMSDYRAGNVIPAIYRPLPVAEVVSQYQSWLRYTDPDCCKADGSHHPAGESGFGFCSATIPVCRDLGGGVLLVDLRPGEKHGVILALYAEDGHHATSWASVADMLTSTADHLHNPDDPRHRNAPSVVQDGVLIWD